MGLCTHGLYALFNHLSSPLWHIMTIQWRSQLCDYIELKENMN